MQHYPDSIQRILIQPGKLKRLFPDEALDYELLFRIRDFTDEALMEGHSLKEGADLSLVRGALFYAVDALDDAMPFFKESVGVPGIYWLGMVRRRAGDFEPARESFRQVGAHGAYAELHARSCDDCADMAKQLTWDPWLYTGLCERFRFGDFDLERMLIQLQEIEFEVMFNHLWRATAELNPV